MRGMRHRNARQVYSSQTHIPNSLTFNNEVTSLATDGVHWGPTGEARVRGKTENANTKHPLTGGKGMHHDQDHDVRRERRGALGRTRGRKKTVRRWCQR